MRKISILWVDDEINFLKSHIIYLEQKNYKVTPCQSGKEALELFSSSQFDIVFIDENMPGLSGLETLSELKEIRPNIPVVMITKSEEEYIMDEAIGNKISDYLIKPVNPNQILLSLKKNLDNNRLISEKVSSNYLQEFRKISIEMGENNDFNSWAELYKKITYWEIELENSQDNTLKDILETQKIDANEQFNKFIQKNYLSWYEDKQAPILSHNLFRLKIAPEIKNNESTLLLVIDNLRYDQWKVIQSTVEDFYKIKEDSIYYSILPTSTQYSRNSIFAGLTPLEIQQKFPNYWKNDFDEGGKNLYENELLKNQLSDLGLSDLKYEYIKITNLKDGKKLLDNFKSKIKNNFTVLVYNFVDMLSHSKTEMEVIKELAFDDRGYRSLTRSWFKNSPLLEIIKKAQNLKMKLIITTDHGTINVKNPSKVIGDKNTSLNLRYKTGKSLSYISNDVFDVKNPNQIGLPSISINSSFIFAKNNLFLVYPNNYNYYSNFYKNSYQHGGISLEEVLIPFVVLNPKT